MPIIAASRETPLLQLHELCAPLPTDLRPGDLVQWASWYFDHLMAGGRRIDLAWDVYRGPKLPGNISYKSPQDAVPWIPI